MPITAWEGGEVSQKCGNTHVAFSVVVPVYEQWHLVPELLNCLQNQTEPENSFEVLLVDNGSKAFMPPSELPDNTRILHCADAGSYAARNAGISHARGQWLAFTDADCKPEPQWLASYRRCFTSLSSHDALLAGPIEVTDETTSKPSIYAIYDRVKGIPQQRYIKKGYAATANLAVSRKLAEIVGGFDARRYSGGDAAFCIALQGKGIPLGYVEQARVIHPARDSWQSIATKARRVKGGQWVGATTPARKGYWIVRTLAPPVLEWVRYCGNKRVSLGCRAIACLVQVRIWTVEIKEIWRLMRGIPAERK